MTLYTLRDALDSLADGDNDLHDGLDPVAKQNIEIIGGTQLQVTFTPYDEDGNADPTRAERFIGEFRRVEEPTS